MESLGYVRLAGSDWSERELIGVQARWAAWLEEEMGKGKSISESDAAEELTRYRAMSEHFAGVTFRSLGFGWGRADRFLEQLAYENISATGENAGAFSSREGG